MQSSFGAEALGIASLSLKRLEIACTMCENYWVFKNMACASVQKLRFNGTSQSKQRSGRRGYYI